MSRATAARLAAGGRRAGAGAAQAATSASGEENVCADMCAGTGGRVPTKEPLRNTQHVVLFTRA